MDFTSDTNSQKTSPAVLKIQFYAIYRTMERRDIELGYETAHSVYQKRCVQET